MDRLKIKNLHFEKKPLHQRDIKFFKKISQIRTKQFIKSENQKIKKWYLKNHQEVNNIFNDIIGCVDNFDINLNTDLDIIHKDFVVFIYKNSLVDI